MLENVHVDKEERLVKKDESGNNSLSGPGILHV